MKNMLVKTAAALFGLFFVMGGGIGCSDESTESVDPIEQKYTITYQTNYGTAPEAQSVAAGTLITDDYLPAMATAQDTNGAAKIFTGWTLDGTAITATDRKAVTKDITLIASWRDKTADDVKYTVKHLQENADNDEYTVNATEELYGTKGAQTVAQAKTFSGFESGTVTQQTIAEDGSTVVEIRYNRVLVTLTLNLAGGTGATTVSGKYGAAVSVSNPEKDGYAFAGWNPALPQTFPAADATYTATWTAVTQAVKVSDIEITGNDSVAKGGSVTLTATVTPTTATTKGVVWSTDKTEADGVTITSGGKLTVSDTSSVESIVVTATAKDGSGVKKDFTVSVIDASAVQGSIEIIKSEGWLESAYVTWKPASEASIDGYNVYIKEVGATDWTKLDDMLVRAYSNTAGGTAIDYYRADALGLKAGGYQMKVVGTVSGLETGAASETDAVTVEAHDRSGFAFTGTTTPGAYEADGTLKENAVVLYLTDSNKKSVTMDVVVGNKNKTETKTGITEILLGYKKGYETRPLAIRVIGNVTGWSELTSAKETKGDIVIENGNGTTGITMEGVGDDATANEWGIRVKNGNYIEIRNIGFVNCSSDETDDIGLQQDNNYIWVHNCDMFYGNAGSDKDQVKGDGALDCKKSNYVTFSYNHFWDNGKCNLLGLSEGKKSYETGAYYITYHHNWYDHSDSRHPRVRYYNAHIYNNYYDGNAKYGAGSTLGSSLFMENNYFRNCKFPMLTSEQGSDLYAGGTTRKEDNGTFSSEDGGVIKAYGNTIVDTNKLTTFIPYGSAEYMCKGVTVTAVSQGINTNTDYDAYVVENRNDTVPDTVKSYQGSNYYSNFDTASGFYTYTVDSPEDAKANVTKYAGRVNGGDISFTFADSEDSNYIVIDALKSTVTNYKSHLVKVLGDNSGTSGNSGDDNGGSTGGDDNGGNTEPVVDDSGATIFTANNTEGVSKDAEIFNTTLFSLVDSANSVSVVSKSVTSSDNKSFSKLLVGKSLILKPNVSGTVTLYFDVGDSGGSFTNGSAINLNGTAVVDRTSTKGTALAKYTFSVTKGTTYSFTLSQSSKRIITGALYFTVAE